MGAYLKRIHAYLETIPDRFYPFATQIEGKWVRGSKSYRKAIDRAFATYGPNRFGFKLVAYRVTFHLLGSILFLICATLLAHRIFGSEIALYVMVCIAIVMLTVQEFYLHPKQYGQITSKGIADWLSWVVPIMLYLSFTI